MNAVEEKCCPHIRNGRIRSEKTPFPPIPQPHNIWHDLDLGDQMMRVLVNNSGVYIKTEHNNTIHITWKQFDSFTELLRSIDLI